METINTRLAGSERLQIAARIYEQLDIMHSENCSDEEIETAQDIIALNVERFIKFCRGRVGVAYSRMANLGLGEIFEIHYPLS